MDNIVAARRLRKSMLKEMDNDVIYDLGYLGKEGMDASLVNKYGKNREKSENDKIIKENGNFMLKFKTKILLKVFFTCLILFSCLVIKLTFKEQALSNKYIQKVKEEYSKDYSKVGVLEKIEELSYNLYDTLGKYIIPEDIKNKIISKYISSIKPYVIEFNLKKFITNEVVIQESASIFDYSNEEVATVYNGSIGEDPIEKDAFFEEASAVSIMQDDVSQILSKNINFIKPLSGTITSIYGARDEVFEGVTSYHTGLDIGAKLGTQIKSVCDGKVVNVEKMNKYYGNNVVIENNGVKIKYAHMKEIKVNLNDNIKQGDIVGLVGSTGMSTGPHLHIEISINSRTVNPQSIIQF